MSKSKILSNPWVVAVLALFCAALWGSATPFIKIGYELILPEKNVPSTILFAGVRFFFTGVITVLIYSIASGKLLYPQKANIGKIAQVSVFQTVLQYIFFYVGLANTSGVKGTILSGTSAFFFAADRKPYFQTGKIDAQQNHRLYFRLCGNHLCEFKRFGFYHEFYGRLLCAFFGCCTGLFLRIDEKIFQR